MFLWSAIQVVEGERGGNGGRKV